MWEKSITKSSVLCGKVSLFTNELKKTHKIDYIT